MYNYSLETLALARQLYAQEQGKVDKTPHLDAVKQQENWDTLIENNPLFLASLLQTVSLLYTDEQPDMVVEDATDAQARSIGTIMTQFQQLLNNYKIDLPASV